jgi:hypothetical protein
MKTKTSTSEDPKTIKTQKKDDAFENWCKVVMEYAISQNNPEDEGLNATKGISTGIRQAHNILGESTSHNEKTNSYSTLLERVNLENSQLPDDCRIGVDFHFNLPQGMSTFLVLVLGSLCIIC